MEIIVHFSVVTPDGAMSADVSIPAWSIGSGDNPGKAAQVAALYFCAATGCKLDREATYAGTDECVAWEVAP